MSDERIKCWGNRAYTKEEFIELIERNFPLNETMEIIVVVTEVETNNGNFQSITFRKNLEQ